MGTGIHHKASITARGASDHNLYQGRSTNHGVACRSPHVLSRVNQEAVADQRCPSARTNSTATKLAIPIQGRRIVMVHSPAAASGGFPPPSPQHPPPSRLNYPPKSLMAVSAIFWTKRSWAAARSPIVAMLNRMPKTIASKIGGLLR